MSPDEKAAFEAALLNGTLAPESVPGSSASMQLAMPQEQSFRDRMMGLAPAAPYLNPGMALMDHLAPGTSARVGESAGRLAEHPAIATAPLGGMGPGLVVGAGRYAADQAASAAGFDPNPGGVSPAQLSAKAAEGAETVTSPGGQILRPQDAVTQDIAPAPTLDPRYGEVGRSLGIGGGVGGGFGDLKTRWRNAQDQYLETLRNQGRLSLHLGRDQANRILEQSRMDEALARKEAQDAESQQRIDADATARHQAFLARNDQLAEEVGRMKVDPQRFVRDATFGQWAWMNAGSIAGGMLQGLQGGTNTFLDRLDRRISEDIQSQLNEIDNKKTQLSERRTMFGQLLQETGDRRLAAMQTRNLTYEAAKQWIKARADALGTPEAYRNAQLAANQMDQRLTGTKMEWAKAAYQQALASAAAAEAARRAAEDKAWQRWKDMTELGIKVDDATTKRLEAQGKVGKDQAKEDQAALSEASKELSKDQIIANRQAIKTLVSMIKKGPDGKESLIGFDTGANLRRTAYKASTLGVVPDTTVDAVTLSPQERSARKAMEQLALGYQKNVTGTGGSDAQMERILKAFEGAKTEADRIQAIRDFETELTRRESLAQAPLDDRQQKLLDQRINRGGVRDMPSTVQRK